MSDDGHGRGNCISHGTNLEDRQKLGGVKKSLMKQHRGKGQRGIDDESRSKQKKEKQDKQKRKNNISRVFSLNSSDLNASSSSSSSASSSSSSLRAEEWKHGRMDGSMDGSIEGGGELKRRGQSRDSKMAVFNGHFCLYSVRG